MIELRWKKCPTIDIYSVGKETAVLQYRTKTVHRESSTTTPVERGWTEWQDVPTVEDK